MNKSRLHILVLLFSLTVTLFLFPREKLYAASSGICGAEGDNLTWTLDDEGTLTISGTGEMGSWDYGCSPWYEYSEDIKKVVIDDGVTNIGKNAFLECVNLSGAEIPDSVTTIGFKAFAFCKSLYEIVIPDSVTSIDGGAFVYCYNLSNVSLSEGLLTIGEGAFYQCGSLRKIVIPAGVTSIGDEAFAWCKSLREIVLPESLTSIGFAAFDLCESLQKITIPQGVTFIGKAAFTACGSLEEIVIPQGVTSISDNTFDSCISLKKVVISEGVTSIGYESFRYCPSLQEIVIPESVTSIDSRAFAACDSLKEIKIPKGVTSIGGKVFEDCYSLQEIEIPESVTSIGYGAFWACSSLERIVIPQGVTSISDYTFCNCKSLKEIVIPEGVTSIGDGAFSGCSSLEKIVIPESVTSIGNSAFSYCSSLKEIVIPEGVTLIGNSAFSECSSLEIIVIPESVTSIGNCAFSFCSSLKEIVIPKGVTSIDDSAFCECGSLQGIIIPESITSIGEAAFKGCHSLTQVFIPKKLYDEIELKKVFDDSAEDIICLYSCINDGNGAVSLKSIDSDFAEVVFNVAPNENFEVDKIYRIDSSGTSEPRELIYRNGECRLYRRGLDMKDLTIYATFTRVRANITFCSEDGTNILQSGTYKINEIPSYTADIPVKEPDGDTTYLFAGWSDGTVTYGINDQLPKVTDDVTYTAVFEEVPQSIPPVSLYKLSSIEGEDKRADIILRINRNEDDENCISYFRSVAVDDVVLANGTQYSVDKGSTVITLKSDYLKTLSEGEHTITVNFKDGAVTASFNNLKRDAESIPATGEAAIKATVGVVLVLAAVSGLAVVLIKRKKTEK